MVQTIAVLVCVTFFTCRNYINICNSFAGFLRSVSLSCTRMLTPQSCTTDPSLNARSYFSDLSLIKVKSTCTKCFTFKINFWQDSQSTWSNVNISLQIPIVETAQVSDFLVSRWLYIRPKAIRDICRNASFCPSPSSVHIDKHSPACHEAKYL